MLDLDSNQLSDNTLQQINVFFKEIDFKDTAYSFKKGVFVNPKFNYEFLVASDTMNFVFIKLYEDTDSVILAINKLLCYSNIIHKFKDAYYPNQSVIYPYDFRFLNADKPSLNIICKNDDDQKFRMVGYDKNLYGSWLVDSVVNNHIEYNPNLI